MSLETVIETKVADAQAALVKLESQKLDIVATLQAHIKSHQTASAQHQAEIAAAQGIINQHYPPLQAPEPTKNAGLVLTSPQPAQLAKYWRIAVLGAIVIVIVTAACAGWIRA